MSKEIINLQLVRTRLAGDKQQRHWRSIEELAKTPEFDEFVQREFPRHAGELRDPVTRRSFLKFMGASLALAGLSACEYNLSQPQEKIVPYVRLPEGLIPGKPLFFATAMPFQGYGQGLVVEQHEGRPTKVDGNPDHPATLGASDIFMQASILTMYDPDRSQQPMYQAQPDSWENFVGAITQALNDARGGQGAGLRILSETITSPTLINQIQALLQEFPQAQWIQYDPLTRDNVRQGAQQAFGTDVNAIYRFDQARIVVALDSDFMVMEPGHLRYARDFTDGRRVRQGQEDLNRFYVAESTPTVTGSVADHRLPVRSSRIAAIARAIAAGVGVAGAGSAEGLSEAEQRWVNAVVEDLQANSGAGVVIAGEWQPPVVHALAHAINAQLNNAGSTVVYTDPIEPAPSVQLEELRQLTDAMGNGQVQVLLMLGGNPVYNAPADLDFAGKLQQVPLSVHYSLFNDETSALSTWHVNATHYLEMWSDVRAFDGTAAIIQPLIAPLYGARSPHELLEALLGRPPRPGYDIVREYWRGQITGEFEDTWQKALRDGVLPNTAIQPRQIAVQANFAPVASEQTDAGGLEIVFRPDPTTWDGSYANNGWMQELPKPFTKLVWDNAVLISPRKAEELGVQQEDVVELRYNGQTLPAPVIVLPGQADESVTVHLGYGRERAGVISAPDGEVIGYNAYTLRTSTAPWFSGGLEIQKTGERHMLVTTRDHYVIDQEVYAAAERRELVRVATLEEYRQNPGFAQVHHGGEGEATHGQGGEAALPEEGADFKGGIEGEGVNLLPEYPYPGYAWGMTVDLNACIGCNACLTACQSENNIAVVGKEQVALGREMHWIRIDQYYHGSLDNPTVYNQPILCMQCEQAPCELVCPVAATVHDAEGLNNMVYNRCVGTKYCSNNCPYKVRRFNFLQYTDDIKPSLKLMRNPNVTVRARGVMEKCTYCVQRINAARQEAERENREIRDGEVLTACQQACPTQAIVFGNINERNSQVAQLKQEPTNYSLLEELNTQPRTTYLAVVRNINPTLGLGEGATE